MDGNSGCSFGRRVVPTVVPSNIKETTLAPASTTTSHHIITLTWPPPRSVSRGRCKSTNSYVNQVCRQWMLLMDVFLAPSTSPLRLPPSSIVFSSRCTCDMSITDTRHHTSLLVADDVGRCCCSSHNFPLHQFSYHEV
jgi:hypothetical protein